MQFLSKIVDVVKFFLGIPDVQDEAAVRAFVQRCVDVVLYVAKGTPVKWDDHLANAALIAIKDDACWAEIYRSILLISQGAAPMAPEASPALTAHAQRLGISPDVIIAVVKLILEILTMLGVLKG